MIYTNTPSNLLNNVIRKIPAFLIMGMLLGLFVFQPASAQVSIGDDLSVIDYSNPKKYEIGGITVSGVEYLDQNVLIMLSGLKIGSRVEVPGEEITNAIKKLWDQGLFEDISIKATSIQGDMIFLDIYLLERPRLTKFTFKGVRKSEADNIRDDMHLTRGDVVTNHLLIRVENIITDYYADKGFLDAEVEIRQLPDTSKANNVILEIRVDKNDRIRIYSINIHGNEHLSDQKAKAAFKETKEKGLFRPLYGIEKLLLDVVWDALRFKFPEMIEHFQSYVNETIRLRIFKSSKFIESNYEDDLHNLIAKYNEQGFRDAKILRDSITRNVDGSMNVDIWVDEGNQYYFRNITWIGNTKYSSEFLDNILKIQKGDSYNKDLLSTRLTFDPNGFDVSSLYLNDGYLFFSAEPVEVLVENDSIDLEIRMREGKQATINKVQVTGNTKTNDHVVIREIKTLPGELFNREAIIRTVRELGQLRYFNPETIAPEVLPNPEDGTVDVIYSVEETSADQIELSGGWGYGRIIGTLGVSFNNFSLKNFFRKGAWRPIPSGDGQKLSLRLQSYGSGYISYSASFTEPWLGGRKPNAFSVSYYHSLYSNGLPRSDTNRAFFKINGLTFGLGQRLKWPDDFFTLYQAINFQRYDLHKYTTIFTFGDGTGIYHNFNYNIVLGRNSTSPSYIYPRSGSNLSLSLEMTPPYSLLNNADYTKMSDNEKYKWIEYHKWKFEATYYLEVAPKFVVMGRLKFGFLGLYNSDIGVTPFERFYLGGDGLSGYNNLDGREIIGMRGYGNETLTPFYYLDRNVGGTVYSKYTLEFRYPLSLNPSATIYALGFLEAGKSWLYHPEFNPFDLYRSAGVGMRVFLPMFGMLGLDWGYGFDDVPGLPGANGGQFHFSINQSID
ncbi:MAG: POTRA domain-containing protein [Bacteroidota bacterium]